MEDRKKQVLRIIAKTYSQTGDPVGSKRVAELLGSHFSSATIRNDMAALFEMGLLEQPHTSAGRIPSHLGYRVYIDELMLPQSLRPQMKDRIDAMFNIRNPDPDLLLKDAATALASVTGCAAFSTTITPVTVTVKRIHILPAGSSTVCILIIASNGVIKSKVCRVDFMVTGEIVEFFNKFSTSRIVGKTLEELSQLYLNSVAISLGEYSMVFTPILSAIYELCRDIFAGQYYLAGSTNLLRYQEFQGNSFELLQYISQKENVLQLVGSDQEKTTKVIVGRENKYGELMDCAVVVCKYNIGNHTTGAIGLIGPVRLDYATAIPYVEYFAHMLGSLLSETYEEQE